MRLKGKRVLLNRPHIEKSVIEMTQDVQDKINKDNFAKWTQLEVFAIGEEVTGINPGDKVYISKNGIEHCEIIEIEDSLKLIVNEGQICLIW
jgi:hypothetical protein